MSTYKGGNIIKGYSKYFGVDKLCAIKELQMLGVKISEERKNQIKDAYNRTVGLHQKKKHDKEERDGLLLGWNEHFAFNAGYTSGGLPYGIEWDKADELVKDETTDASQLQSPLTARNF